MKRLIVLLALGILLTACQAGDDAFAPAPKSASGVKKVAVKVQTDRNGQTVEQKNIIARLKADNAPGSIKHLYVFSAYSGDTLLYSTVKGKVTSSGKRLTPKTVSAGLIRSSDFGSEGYGVAVVVGGRKYRTNEVLRDDGTYGNSIPYLYWFDAGGKYHQHYISGGQIIHVSDTPIRLSGKPRIEIEMVTEKAKK